MRLAIERRLAHKPLAIEEGVGSAVPLDLEEAEGRRPALLDDEVDHAPVGDPLELPEDLVVTIPRGHGELEFERDLRHRSRG